jgi:hypothetical protein
MFRGGRHLAEQNRSPFPQGRCAPSVFLRLSALGAQRPTIATGVLSYSVYCTWCDYRTTKWLIGQWVIR